MKRGLNGFWDVFKDACTVVGGMVGGAFGAYLGNIAGEAISSWATGDDFDNSVFYGGGIIPGLNAKNQDELMNWHESLFAPWIKIEAQKIKTVGININNANYRQKINTLLLKLQALRLYYQSKQVQGKSFQGKSFGVTEEQLNAAKNKSEIIDIYIKAISQAYRKTLKDNGVFSSRAKTKFKAHEAQFDAPETLKWNGVNATTDVYVFTEQNQEGIPSIDYNGLFVSVIPDSQNTPFDPTNNAGGSGNNAGGSGNNAGGSGNASWSPGDNAGGSGDNAGGSGNDKPIIGGEEVNTQTKESSVGKWLGAIFLAIGIGSYYTRKSKTKK